MSGRRDGDDLDTRLEQGLSDLFDGRDPGPAPRTLGARVDRVPERTPLPRSGHDRLTSSLVAVAGIAAAILLVVVLGPLLGGRIQGPVASLLPSAPAVSPGVSPVGTIPPDALFGYPELRPAWYDSGPQLALLEVLPVVLLVLAAGVLIAAAIHSLRPGGAGDVSSRLDRVTPRRQGAGWLAIAVLFIAYALTAQPMTARVNGWGGPWVVGNPDEQGEVIAPHPGQVTTVEAAFTNEGLLPVTIEGLGAWPGATSPVEPERIITMRVLTEQAMAIPAPGPFTVWPGQSVYFRMAYRHLPCEAWGVPAQPQSTPWPTPDAQASFAPVPDGTAVTGRSTFPLRVTIAGIARTLQVESGFTVGSVVPTACPPTEPLAPADLSAVPADLSLAGVGPSVFTDDTMSRPGPDLVVYLDLALLAAALGLAVLVMRRAPREASRVVGTALVVGIAAAVACWTVQPPPLVAGPTGLGGQGLVAEGTDEPDIADIGPGGVFTFSFTLENEDALPVTLVGVHDSAGQARVTGFGRPWGAASVRPEDAIVLDPFTDVAPGASIHILAKGTVGACARRLTEAHDAWIMLTGIPWTVERLGRRYTTMVPLPSPIRVPADAACLAFAAMASDGREAWYPAGATAGIVADASPAPLLVVVIGGIVVLVVAGLRLRRTRRRRAAIFFGAAAILGAWVAAAQVVPVNILVSAAANGEGTVANPNAEANLYLVTAGPGESFTQTFWLRTTGMLPVRLDGVLAGTGDGPWTGLWLAAPNPGGFSPASRPFSPVTLGDTGTGFWLAGTADACAMPGLPAGTMPESGADFTEARIRLAVTVLGFRRTVDMPSRYWPLQVLSPTGKACLPVMTPPAGPSGGVTTP